MNEYFQAGSVPPYNGIGSSAQMRAEFASIATAFDKLPVMAGSADEFVLVNSTGTALVASNYKFTDFATVVGEQTLINKTIVWADNKISTIPVAGGGTGAINVPEAQKNLGIDLKADARNAVLTGAPTCPTPPLSDRGGRVANTQFVADTLKAIGAAVPSDNLPLMDGGVAVAGVSNFVSRDDHIHEHDSSRAVAAAETAAGTSFVSTPTIAAKDVQAAITELDTKKAPLISPVFTGNPKAPSPKTDSNDTSVATTAYTKALIAQQPIGVQLSDDLPLHDAPTPLAGIGVDASRYDHVHATDPSRAPIADPTFTGNVGINIVGGSTRLEVGGGGSYNAIASRATYEGTLKINEGLGATLQSTAGLEFKCSGYQAGYGAKVLAEGDGTLLIGNRANSKDWTLRAKVALNGDVLVTSAALLGYGPDAGGTVTQATSKSTGVTLNRPSGQITMNNEALAAGSSIQFVCDNTLVSANDICPCQTNYPTNYSIRSATSAGRIYFILQNEFSTALSDPVIVSFEIFKGAVA